MHIQRWISKLEGEEAKMTEPLAVRVEALAQKHFQLTTRDFAVAVAKGEITPANPHANEVMALFNQLPEQDRAAMFRGPDGKVLPEIREAINRQIDEARKDTAFQERLRESIDRDRPLLDRLRELG
jgi:hypothetical protein